MQTGFRDASTKMRSLAGAALLMVASDAMAQAADDPKAGRAPAVGNTVDLKTGAYTNTIGALCWPSRTICRSGRSTGDASGTRMDIAGLLHAGSLSLTERYKNV